MMTRMKHLLSTKDLDLEVVDRLFLRTEKLKRLRGILSREEKILQGHVVAILFWEPSTRTRMSFELAAYRLGAGVLELHPKESSVIKGETIDDTVANLHSIGCNFFVVRHPTSGEVARLAATQGRDTYFINGGDGANEHPCQALLDAFTIRERRKTFDGVRVAIIGDILRSRVARSNLHLLTRLGASCVVSGPKELLPKELEVGGVEIEKDPAQAVKNADVVMVLRLQRERAGITFDMTEKEYHEKFGLTAKLLQTAKPDAMVMHPGPINRGVEIDSDVADGSQSFILRQSENGLFMRMAVFEALRGELG